MAKWCKQWNCPITEIDKVIVAEGVMCNIDCEECESYYDTLDGKIINARELRSMIEAQASGKKEDIKEFAERIIDLIYSHAKYIPTFPKEKCEHKNKFSYNHDYHTICKDCGEEIY